MLNTEKPVMLTARGVIIISLDTFKNVRYILINRTHPIIIPIYQMMNITYRFFAIIRRVLGN